MKAFKVADTCGKCILRLEKKSELISTTLVYSHIMRKINVKFEILHIYDCGITSAKVDSLSRTEL